MSSTQGTFSVAELVGIVIGTTAAVLIIVSVILLSVIRRRRQRRETEARDWGYQPQTWEETLPRQSQVAPIPQQPVMRQPTPPMDLSPIFSPTSTHNLEEALLRAERVNSDPQPEPQPCRYSHSQTTSPTSPIQYLNPHQFPDPPAPAIIPLYQQQQQQQHQQQQPHHQHQYIRKETDSISSQSPTYLSPFSQHYSSPLSPHYSSPQQRFARATMTSNPASSRQSSTRSSRRDWPMQRQDSSSGGFRRLSTLSGRIRDGRHNNDSPAELWTTANVAEMDDTQTPRPKAPSFFESPVLGTLGLHVSIVKPKQSKGSLRTGSIRSGG
ncbi:hypothetical protein PspLS_07890 [Pyricularia sp. CBS 133598]|nr:hypothetical protein PspLS_07890 [Pyricularia sp. CBS 133598]